MVLKYHSYIHLHIKNKKMKKILSAVVITVISLSVNAQKNSNVLFNVGAEIGFATGNLNLAYSIGIGATANLEYAINDKTNITLNSGLIEYIGKKLPGTTFKNRSVAAFPILGGTKYFFTDNFYGAAQIGVTIFSGAGQSSKFTYSPGLGFKANQKIDLLLKYTGYADLGGAFGVRVAYTL